MHRTVLLKRFIRFEDDFIDPLFLSGLQCENVVFINSCGPGKCLINCGYCYVTSLNDVLLEYNV